MNTIALNENCRKLTHFTRTNSKANRNILVRRERARFPVGEIPTRQLSLQPVATAPSGKSAWLYFHTSSKNLSTESQACFNKCESVDLLIGRCAGIVSIRTSS